MPRLLAPEPGCGIRLSEGYTGESLDVSSRSRVRSIVTNWVTKGEWAAYWYGMSRVPRGRLIRECISALDRMADKNPGKEYCYSVQAVAEEVDFFLPKAFWCHRIRKKRAPKATSSSTVVDPDWPSMAEKWHWYYPDATPERLQVEYAKCHEEAHRRKKMGHGK